MLSTAKQRSESGHSICCDNFNGDTGTFNRAQLQLDGTLSGTTATTLDNIPAGVNGDLANGTPSLLVTAGDGFRLAPGQAMTVIYQVTVDDPLDGSVLNIDNTASIDSAEQADPVVDAHSLGIDFAPVLSATKSGPASAAVGDTVVYTVTVSHAPASDGSPVSVLTVSDDVAGPATYVSGDTNVDTLLDLAETWSYTVSHTVTPGDSDPLNNIATITGTDADGDPVSTTDSHSTTITHNPVLNVVKSGLTVVGLNQILTYTILVSHDVTSDGSDVTGVSVTDDVAGAAVFVSGDDGDTILENGETWVYTASHTVLLPDPNPLVNVATASGTNLDGGPVTANDTHSATVDYAPILRTTKTGPATAAVGDLVTYNYVLDHAPTSDFSPISSLSLSDDITGTPTFTGGDTNSNGLLEFDESWTYTATYTVLATDPEPLINTATGSGLDGNSDPTIAQDQHSLDIDWQPTIELTKTGPSTAVVGDVVVYAFSATHAVGSDGSAIGGVTVSDDIAGAAAFVGGDSNSDGYLDLGETWTWSASHLVVASDPNLLTNTGTVIGADTDADVITDTDVHVTDIEFAPVLDVAKTGQAAAAVGDVISYTFAVGHAPASDGSPMVITGVNDDITGPGTYSSGDANTNGMVEAGETWIYTASHTVAATSPNTLSNTVTVDATDGDGDAHSAADTHSLDVSFAPALLVTKTGPATAVVGDNATYTFAVTHDPSSDGSPMLAISVVDDIAGTATFVSGDDGDTLLEFGETWTYTASHTVTTTDADPLVNIVTASAADRDGDPISDTDTHSLPIEFAPVLVVSKTGPATANVGDTLNYFIDVTHAPSSDGSAVSALLVNDDVAGAAALLSGDDGDGLLELGETWTFTATHVVVISDPDPLVNIATASGTDRDGDAVNDTDSHSTDLTLAAPVLNIVKTGPATTPVGDTATYTFTVTHDVTSDGSPINTVSVTDDIAGAAIFVSGDDGNALLEAAETWIYTASRAVLVTDADPLINTATVNGLDQFAGALSANDTHSLDVDFVPQIQIVKSGPTTALLGDVVTYTFLVSHAAGSDGSNLATVTVTDDVAGAASFVSGDDGDTLLEAGETWIYTASHTVTAGDPDPLVNLATANAIDLDGDPITDTDTHSLNISFLPLLEITKTGPASVTTGTLVTYSFSVSHDPASDGSDIAGLTVVDDIAGVASYVSGDDGDGVLETSGDLAVHR